MDEKVVIRDIGTRMVDRRVAPTQMSEIVTMATMLLTMPRPTNVDAIVVLPGQGEDWRLTHAVDVWNAHLTARHLLVAGSYGKEETWVMPTVQNLTEQPFNLRRTKGVRIQPHAHHTPEQAMWLLEKVRELDLSSFALCVSPYHLLRAFGTIVKTWIKEGEPFTPIIPMPVFIPPDVIVPEQGIDAWGMSHGEVERIIKYQEKGDVVTFDEFMTYVNWLWTQSMFTAVRAQ